MRKRIFWNSHPPNSQMLGGRTYLTTFLLENNPLSLHSIRAFNLTLKANKCKLECKYTQYEPVVHELFLQSTYIYNLCSTSQETSKRGGLKKKEKKRKEKKIRAKVKKIVFLHVQLFTTLKGLTTNKGCNQVTSCDLSKCCICRGTWESFDGLYISGLVFSRLPLMNPTSTLYFESASMDQP